MINTNLTQLQNIARKHLGKGDMESSARLCLSRSIQLMDDESNIEAAKEQALKSIKYSIGIMARDYIKAQKLV